MRRPPAADVAIYSPHAAALYLAGVGTTGGAELQSYYIASALARGGLHVRHIVAPEGGELAATDGVELVCLDRRYHERGVARRRAIFAGLRLAAARVLVQRSAGFETGTVGAFARVTGRRFVFSSSSTVDFAIDSSLAALAGTSLDHWPSRLQYRIGLHLADEVVVQTNEQRDLVRMNLGVDASVIPSFAEVRVMEPRPRATFLWVGALIEIKDPFAYMELARNVPEARFLMLATDRGEHWRDLVRRVNDEARTLPNFELLSARPRDELLHLYASAVAVVNTSLAEGFPNTFLEAWSHGTPTLSLRVDPDGTIERFSLGSCAGGSLARLAEATRAMWSDPDSVDRESIRSYVQSHHDPDVVGPQWVQVLRELLDS
jgi:glycosyltransferase involved in cell wall biosynthesis